MEIFVSRKRKRLVLLFSAHLWGLLARTNGRYMTFSRCVILFSIAGNLAFYPFRWLIYVFNSVVNTKLPAILSHRRRTTVSLETYPFILFSIDWFAMYVPHVMVYQVIRWLFCEFRFSEPRRSKEKYEQWENVHPV